MRKYVVMGVQGCGKGTQAKLLAQRFDLTHICVGDIFRWNIQRHTKLAARIKRVVDGGDLVPDEIVEEVIQRRLQEHDWNFGFVLDGFPRNRAQAEFFLESYDIDAVVLIEASDDAVVERVLARRLCNQCGLDYNLIFHRPETPGVCDVCRGTLEARPDDVEQVVRNRIANYHVQTAPVVKVFERKELVFRVDGHLPANDLHLTVCDALKLPRP